MAGTEETARKAADAVEREAANGDIGVSASGLSPADVGTSSSGQEASGHWLDRGSEPNNPTNRPDNRAKWWDRRPMDDPSGLSAERDFFRASFHPALRSIIDWEGVADGNTPNAHPDIGFTVVPAAPISVPVVRHLDDVQVQVWEDGLTPEEQTPRGAFTVLVNALAVGAELPAGAPWPDLLLVFDRPQCEVGLEYGFIDDPAGTPIGHIKAVPAVVLDAFDRDGNLVVHGEVMKSDETLETGEIHHLIGVRDREGGIVSVRLSFRQAIQFESGETEGPPLRAPQVIRRVWHEPFPPAAVLEGTARLRRTGGIVERPPFRTRMPFRCDRVVAYLRGFHLKYLGDEPRAVGAPRVAVSVRRTIDGGLQVDVEGQFGSHDYVLDVYFTLVAWEQSLFHLHAVPFSVGDTAGDVESDEGVLVAARAPDPCPTPRAPSNCGRVFAAPSTISLATNLDELERWLMASRLPDRDALGLRWPVVQELWQSEDTVFFFAWRVDGTFLTGPDLRLSGGFSFVTQSADEDVRLALAGWDPSQRGFPLVIPRVGPRPLPEERGYWALSTVKLRAPDPVTDIPGPDYRMAAPGDQAFAALGGFMFHVDDRVRELEIEVSSPTYDGMRFDWQLGVGASADAPSEAANESLEVTVDPIFAVLQSRANRLTEGLSSRDAMFRARPGLVAFTPDQFGLIVNTGERPITLMEVALYGPDAADFRLVIGLPNGATFPLAEFYDHAPVRLAPGQTVVIGGECTGSSWTVRNARLVFSTNARRFPTVTVGVKNFPRGDLPSVYLTPDHIAFKDTKVGTVRVSEKILLQVFGVAPLLVRGIQVKATGSSSALPSPFDAVVEDTQRAHKFTNPFATTRWQVEAGGYMVIKVTFEPKKADAFAATLEVDTDVGVFSVDLKGKGVLSP